MNLKFKIKQHPASVYINEAGLYSLLISSRSKRAKKFVYWITHDVLPLMRQKKNISSR